MQMEVHDGGGDDKTDGDDEAVDDGSFIVGERRRVLQWLLIVTLEDVVEEIVGEIFDENDSKANTGSDSQKEPQKAQLSATSSSSAGCPLEDADSRTIFASNVIAIVTDAATGQPKGAAYVEFMRKEAADNALSLDGTSFMSRILKVVRKSAANQESAPAVPWPRTVRGSPFPSARFSGITIPRGMPGAFRPRPPIKFGARSMQWKRDAQGTSSDNVASSNNSSISAPAARGFTYVGPESKLEGS